MATTSPPATIKTIHQPDILSAGLILEETPLPKPSHPEDVLVKVYAASPCNGELWWARDYPSIIPADREPVPCPDVAGTVVWAPETSKFKPGDQVFARTEANRPGNGREYTLVRESELALKPRSFDWITAAATPLSALTAFQGIFTQGTLDAAALEGDEEARTKNSKLRVLVTGAGGSVGGWAVQFAAAAGAGSIVAVSGPSGIELVKKLGATEIVDYTVQSVDEWAKANPSEREVDLVFDCVGGASVKACWSAVKTGGVILTVVGGDASKPDGMEKTVAKSAFFVVEPLGSQLAQIAKVIDAGKAHLAPLIDSVVQFSDFQKAFDLVASGRAKGKVIIKIVTED
jgi:NADPH:quinone reductase-like Zn-dependent oxidoreductase